MNLKWLTDLGTSALHAAAAFARGHLFADSRLAEVIAEPAQSLRQTILATGVPNVLLWRNLVGLSATIDNNHQLAEVALRKTGGAGLAELHASRLTAHVLALESAVRQAYPDLLDELALRTGPLQRQWEAVGPGLLHQIAELSDERLLVPRADVLLVQPALGGGGEAHLLFNSVRIEAVLVDPQAGLPEVLRLGWLLSQLNTDLPIFGEAINAHRLPLIAELAMIPLVLQAAERAGLAQLDQSTLDLAINTWHVVTPADMDPVERLWRWWETYADTRPAWNVAFAALDRMFT